MWLKNYHIDHMLKLSSLVLLVSLTCPLKTYKTPIYVDFNLLISIPTIIYQQYNSAC